ncbi:hypothetical protein ACFV6E_37720 [Streptomyces sp. NPDC059785]|uniref:hypothetical protein n=1 Tax=Streptomyces sp. NPDC059785 TaxID=3346945 RepID=UPI00365E833A
MAGQDPADRLDPEHLPVCADERCERSDGRSGSAVKKTDAASKISLAAAARRSPHAAA